MDKSTTIIDRSCVGRDFHTFRARQPVDNSRRVPSRNRPYSRRPHAYRPAMLLMLLLICRLRRYSEPNTGGKLPTKITSIRISTFRLVVRRVPTTITRKQNTRTHVIYVRFSFHTTNTSSDQYDNTILKFYYDPLLFKYQIDHCTVVIYSFNIMEYLLRTEIVNASNV